MRDITLDSVATDAQKRFGTFLGVFTPSILTILGVIMYQRLGWVVGQVGYLGAIGVVVLAHVISVTTGLSVASIATNHTVRTGGNYYIISRSLGLSVGGAIGLALYAALALGVSLYLIGFAEAFIAATGYSPTQDPANDIRLIGSVACLFLAVLTLWSTEIAVRSQLFVLVAIAVSLVAIFFGSGVPAEAAATAPEVPVVPFAAVFAVFFPAVTGFTAGVGMSGDLRDPKRAIPLGTMAAIGTGLMIYLALVWLLASRVPAEVLRADYNVLRRMAIDPRFVTVGVFAATLSSALGSMLGAPRTLQALALDGIVSRVLGPRKGRTSGRAARYLVDRRGRHPFGPARRGRRDHLDVLSDLLRLFVSGLRFGALGKPRLSAPVSRPGVGQPRRRPWPAFWSCSRSMPSPCSPPSR